MKPFIFKPFIFRYLIYGVFVFSLSSCITQPKSGMDSHAKNISWDSRATIQDLIQKKTHTVNIKLFMKDKKQLRMEITGLMGFNIASILIDEIKTAYCIYPQKKCYSGALTEQSFRPLFSFTLHPHDFFKIPWDDPLDGSDWNCSKSVPGRRTCSHLRKKIELLSTLDKEGGVRVEIKSPQFLMTWSFEPPQTEVQLDDKLFNLVIPKNYSNSPLIDSQQ